MYIDSQINVSFHLPKNLFGHILRGTTRVSLQSEEKRHSVKTEDWRSC